MISKKIVVQSLALAAFAGALTGCGSSSGVAGNVTSTLDGKGVDPYLKGCAVTVYNATGAALGTGTTGDAGAYTIAGLPDPLPAGAYAEIVGGGSCMHVGANADGTDKLYPATSKLQASLSAGAAANISPFTTLAKASGNASDFAAKLGLTVEQLNSDPMLDGTLAQKSAALGAVLSALLATPGANFQTLMSSFAAAIPAGFDPTNTVALVALAQTVVPALDGTALTSAINTIKNSAAREASKTATSCTVGAGGLTGAGSIISVDGKNVCAFTGVASGSICTSSLLTGAGTILTITGASTTYYCGVDAAGGSGLLQ